MTLLDLFTAPDCPACPTARAVVAAFARENPGVSVREWDLTRDPGPAVGRGIVARWVQARTVVTGERR